MRVLTQNEIDLTLKAGELPSSVIGAGDKVVVILTQDWCHQWQDMKTYLPEFDGETEIFTLEYNCHKDFQKIMGFKEETFGNYEVPYLRYYFKGTLIAETNWIPRGTFAALLKREKSFKLSV